MDERRKLLEQYTKQLREENPLMEDFVKERSSSNSKAFQARNLAEDALANEVQKNSGIPMPHKGASRSKQEDYLNRMLDSTHPEIIPDVRLSDDIPNLYGTADKGKILVNADIARKDMLQGLSTALHENGHVYDDKMLGFKGTPDVDLKALKDSVPKGRMLQDIDPAHAYELMAQGHHAQIPNLRNGSFGLGGLKSYLKSGAFRSVPVLGTGLAAYSALDSGDVMAAVPGLDSAENVGQSPEDEKLMLKEIQARKNYASSPAAQDKNQALRALALQSIAKK